MKWVLMGVALVTLTTVAVLGFRGKINENRPLMLVPDMDFQPRYQPQRVSRFFADGKTNRTPPAGTIPFAGGGDPGGHETLARRPIYGSYSADAGSPRSNPAYLRLDPGFETGKVGSDYVVKNPLPIDMTTLKRGQERFNINCAVCHGGAGLGNGITTKYGLNVPTYHHKRLREVADGYIFEVITRGKGTMMPYAHQVKPGDRWAIVAYIRALQRSQGGSLADVPEQFRSELETR